MQYLTVKNIHKTFTMKPLLDGVEFSISKGQKVALVAQNGAGKSTLLKIIMGQIDPSQGEVVFNKNIRVWFLAQTFNVDPTMNVLEALFRHDHELGQLIRQYEQMLLHPDTDDNDVQVMLSKIEEANARDYEVQVKTIISKLQLTPLLEQTMWSLSGWEAKRVALAKVLLDEPDFLILDEPTNHLDVEMIEWLERYLSQSHLTLLMVTHDRYFLDGVCTDIIELERGKMYNYSGWYEEYLTKKAEREELEQRALHHMKQLWRKELAWVRKAPRGRGTKSVSREKKFDHIDDHYFDTRATLQQAAKKLTLAVEPRRLGSKIIKIHHLKKSFWDKVILKDFSHDFKEWERVWVIGKNGVGKTTFINILAGDEKADNGDIQIGEKVVIWHYQQKDIQFNTDQRVIDLVRDVAPFIQLGKTKLSAAQLLERFLFSPAMQQVHAHSLSGWEKRRLHLLIVLIQNPNFLILDEPTNDLDLMTLAILEDFLLDYTWCLMIISHDRYFMDKIVDHIFAFEWDGVVTDFWWTYTGYTQHKASLQQWIKKQEKKAKAALDDKSPSPVIKKKLTFQEKHEFEKLWAEIALLEKRVDEINFIFQHQTVGLNDMKKLGKEMDTLVTSLGVKETRRLELCERE
jgi:ABC transport system ATP-binding/permease protein